MTREYARDAAGFLYDGGWRPWNRKQMIAEYGLNEEEADWICERLEEIVVERFEIDDEFFGSAETLETDELRFGSR